MEKKIIATPMSNVLIDKYFDGRANIKSLASISKMTDLSQVMENYDHCFIFISTNSENDGHWNIIFKKNGILYWFDSYGDKPLEILKEVFSKLNTTWGQNRNLIRLIEKAYPKGFFYNKKKYQKQKNDVQTCGRYCTLVGILNKILNKFSLDIFEKLMNYWSNTLDKSYDEVTAFFINKL